MSLLRRKKWRDEEREKDPVLFDRYCRSIKQLGDHQGYKTVSCPHCTRLLWTETEIVEPNLDDEILRRFEQSWHESGHPYTNVFDTLDMYREYVDRVTELGREKGLKTLRCPECSNLLWSKTEIFPARH